MMRALQVWKSAIADKVDFLDELIALLHHRRVRYCVIDGQGVNAYVEPLISLDLDLVVATDQVDDLEEALSERFKVEHFPHSVNVSAPGSDLRVQFQTDPRYAEFLDHAETRDVLGLDLPVASVRDVLRGKVWAALASTRRPSKDLPDIERLLEAFPALRDRVPEEILAKLS